MIERIQMVDLHGQYLEIKDEVDAGIKNVIDTTAFINGQDVKLFAQELADYLGCKRVITCANGTDAIQIGLQALELPVGSEIIVPSFNYVAAVEMIVLLGFRPVFVDSDALTFNINTEKIQEKITPKTKAIIAVHLFGQVCDMDKIMDIAQKNDLYVIEDTAQSIGAKYKNQYAGTIGHIGTTSFFPSKNLSCMGDGGAIYTNHDELANKMGSIAKHGQSTKYYYERVGINSRLDTIQAIVLRIKLKKLNEYIQRRKNAANFYNHAFSGKIDTPFRCADSTHVFHQYTLKFEDENQRDYVKNQLMQHDIPSMIYYPLPLHQQNAYTNFATESLPIAEKLCKQVLSLPMHTELNQNQLEYITQNVLNAL